MDYTLFLDDERSPWNVTWAHIPQNWPIQVVRNYDEFVAHVHANGLPKLVCFDHDLADQHYQAMLAETQGRPHSYGPEKTGLDAAKWLVSYCAQAQVKFPPYVVHSMNPVGGERIRNYIEDARKHLGI